jgi:hypothetical protein
MIGKILFIGVQFVALLGILCGVMPSLVYQWTKYQGLKVSLSLFIYYFFQGSYYLLHGARHERSKRAVISHT